MDTALDRIQLLIGQEKLNLIQQATVVVFGCGGVGAMCAESLVRHGVGHLVLVDFDVVSISNINRQIHATTKTVNAKKVEALASRLLDINPQCVIDQVDEFVSMDNLENIIPHKVDAIVDAIDTITSKLALMEYAQANKIPLASSMGMGNRMDPTKVSIMQLRRTFNDPLAKVMRYQCRKRGLNDKINVVSSTEIPIKQKKVVQDSNIRKHSQPPASGSFVPLAAGLACGYLVIKSIIEKEEI